MGLILSEEGVKVLNLSTFNSDTLDLGIPATDT